MAIAERLDCRLDDEIRRAEIGLTDAEIDDVAAGGRKLHGAREHGKGILLADAIEGGDSLQHGVSPDRIFRAAVQPNPQPKANLVRSAA